MHALLRRQLKEVGLDPENPPDADQWRRFLEGLGPVLSEGIEERQEELEHAVHEGEERYKSLMLAIPEVIFSLSVKDGSLTSLSRAFETLTGSASDDWLGRPFTDLSHPEDVQRAVGHMHNVLVGETPPAFEMRMLAHDDSQGKSYRSVEVLLAPEMEDNRMTRVLGIAHDITGRKRVEKDLRAAMAAAQSASRAKSQFLASMSHEIRTPMNAIIGMTGLLHDTELTERQNTYVETIRSGSDTLLALINDILDFSKIESGKLELEHQPFSIRDCLDGAFALVSSTAAHKKIMLRRDIADDCPQFLVGDVTRVRQVLVNLLSNAVKFTQEGQVEVGVTSQPLGKDLAEFRFAVRDTGPGIPDDRLDAIFESFSQVDASTTRKFGGTGLGLAISRRLVELMGGGIWVESAEGKGSQFSFTVPAETATQLQTPKVAPKPIDGKLSEKLPLRILVAEDNVVNQRVALMILERLGYMRVELAANGLEALAALERKSYDLILMDVQMPELDGLEATRRICAHYPEAERPWIVAMTAGAMDGDREQCHAAGMNDYVSKPVKVEELQAAIERTGRRRTMRSET
jgi:PAS domain S-box-containing protein